MNFSGWNFVFLLPALFLFYLGPNPMIAAAGVMEYSTETLAAISAAGEGLETIHNSCLTPKSRAKIGRMQSTMIAAGQNLQKNSAQFFQVAQKIIEGNGRCEGGFDSIANGMQEKILAGERAENIVLSNMIGMMSDYFDQLETGSMTFTGGPERCIVEDGPRALSHAKGLIQAVFPAVTKLYASIDQEVVKLREYHAQNKSLQAKCGADGTNVAALLPGRASSQATASLENSIDNASTVTGKIGARGLESSAGNPSMRYSSLVPGSKMANTSSDISKASPEKAPGPAFRAIGGKAHSIFEQKAPKKNAAHNELLAGFARTISPPSFNNDLEKNVANAELISLLEAVAKPEVKAEMPSANPLLTKEAKMPLLIQEIEAPEERAQMRGLASPSNSIILVATESSLFRAVSAQYRKRESGLGP